MPPVSAPRLILVEPQIPGNLGFAARLVENFGVEDWVQVRGAEWRGSEAERTGAMALSALDRLRRADDLAAAAAGCSHLVGFTARAGRHRQPAPLAALGALRGEWGPEARVGLVFGREDRGLETEETEACAALLTIPTAGFSSLNLSHAVAVALYEWGRAEGAGAGGEEAADPAAEAVWATEEDRRRLAAKAAEELAAAGYPDRGEELPAVLRRLTARPLEARDLRVLERIVRHAAWRRENGPGGG
jgi:TrmH family RNA methyltransferase